MSSASGERDRAVARHDARASRPRLSPLAVFSSSSGRRAGSRSGSAGGLGELGAGRSSTACFARVSRVRVRAHRRAERRGAPPDRRQPRLVARHSRARLDRADDASSPRRRSAQPAGRADSSRCRASSTSTASGAPHPRVNAEMVARDARRASRWCCSPRRRPATAIACCASAPRISRRSRQAAAGGGAGVHPAGLSSIIRASAGFRRRGSSGRGSPGTAT